MKLEEIASLASVAVDEDLSADDIEALIRKLAVLRARTDPPVQPTPPTLPEAGSKFLLTPVDDPDVKIAALTGGRLRFWIRHVGLGWFVADFSAEKSRLLRDYAVKWVDGVAPVNLIGDDLPEGPFKH